MITLKELDKILKELLQPQLFSDFCPNGLQIEGLPNINTVGLAVSASLSTIRQAVEKGVQALIVHHGIFWMKDDYPIVGVKKDKLRLLFDQETSLFGYHLPLDAHQEVGNNWKAAKDLGWENLEPFYSIQGSFIGVKGTFSPRSRKDFQESIEKYYEHPAHVALGGKETVQSAALVSGGAHRQIVDAIQSGVDCFITGSFDEPTWNQAYEGKINFYALGHSATERIGPKALARYLKDVHKIDTIFFEDTNPF